jgi:hypothetical protein
VSLAEDPDPAGTGQTEEAKPYKGYDISPLAPKQQPHDKRERWNRLRHLDCSILSIGHSLSNNRFLLLRSDYRPTRSYSCLTNGMVRRLLTSASRRY